MKSALRSRDVHQNESAAVAGVFEQAANRELAGVIVDLQSELVASFRAERIAHPNVVAVQGCVGIVSRIGAGGGQVLQAIADEIKADERNGLFGLRQHGE